VRAFGRRALLQSAGAGLFAAGIAACDSTRALALPAPSASPSAAVTPAVQSFRSAARRGITEDYQVLLPPGHTSVEGLPICLVLHGFGDDHRAAVKLVHLDKALTTMTNAGAPPIALVAPDGGTDNYWHARATGDDPQKMLLTELLPRLAAAGAQTERFGLFGWSMGAYGSLLLAETVGPSRVAFVAADSPALWLTGGQTPTGAFDDAQDFDLHNVFVGRPKLAGIPVRVMCGRSDGFAPATREFVTGVPDLVAADFPVGGHDATLWASTAVAQLTPLAHALG
jgi:S-formylglutathione hydrolase FrmB